MTVSRPVFDNTELHGALLTVENGVGRITLGENDVRRSVSDGRIFGSLRMGETRPRRTAATVTFHGDSSDYRTAVHIRGTVFCPPSADRLR